MIYVYMCINTYMCISSYTHTRTPHIHTHLYTLCSNTCYVNKWFLRAPLSFFLSGKKNSFI